MAVLIAESKRKKSEPSSRSLRMLSSTGVRFENAISTARQLAMFRKEKMGYEHLKVVIAEAKKFENYLLELNDGFSPDDISKIEKTRL